MAADDEGGIEIGDGGGGAGLVGGDGVLETEDSVTSAGEVGGRRAGRGGHQWRSRWRTTGGEEGEGREAEAADPRGAEGPGAFVLRAVEETVLGVAAGAEVEVASLASNGAL